MTAAPSSILPVEVCVGGRELSEPRLRPDGAAIGYLATADATAEPSTVRFVWHEIGPDGSIDGARSWQPSPAPRRGRGFGGGCWAWTSDGRSVVMAAVDGNLWLLTLATGAMRQITDHGPDRVAQAPAVAPGATAVAYVIDQAEVWIIDEAGDDGARRVDDGSADFCFDPVIAPLPIDGSSRRRAGGIEMAWQAWNVPDMPWDGARLERHLVGAPDGSPSIVTAGAAQQPRFAPDGRLACIRDDGGWSNVWIEDRPLVTEPCEHGGPSWGLGQRSFAFAPDGREVAFTRNECGFGRLCVVDVATGEVRDIARGVHGQISWVGRHVAALRSGARTPMQVVLYDVARSDVVRTVVASVLADAEWVEQLVEPELVEVPARDGQVLHGRLSRGATDPARLICWLHGGPTDQWQVTFMPRIAYWRSRGWNVLVPDHRGSTGHGRTYQQALRGRWGELDVTDTIDALHHAHQRGLGTPQSTVLIGGSAGGFTVLGVLRAAPELVRAGVVASPVSDLADLAERSHRFERHSTETLVGELHSAAGAARARDRSPWWYGDQIRTPLLVLHGADDPVVPVQQSRVLVERIRTAGGEVELCVYPGEGHGFRRIENQLDEYRRIGAFLHRHVP